MSQESGIARFSKQNLQKKCLDNHGSEIATLPLKVRQWAKAIDT